MCSLCACHVEESPFVSESTTVAGTEVGCEVLTETLEWSTLTIQT